jgi:hypothetical protein
MLPIIETPKYTLELPSTKETVEFRPFLVKEEKRILTAIESSKEEGFKDAISNATFDIIKNCTFGKIKPEKLPVFDNEFLFLNIRSRSRGDTIEATFVCQNDIKGTPCGTSNDVSVDINDIKVEYPEKDHSKVMINDDVGIQFKYLSAGELKAYNKETSQTERLFKIIVDSIDFVFDDEKVYKGSETPKKELMNFVEALGEQHFKEIKMFFDEQPSLKHVIPYKCSECGYEEEIVIEGLESFFDLA